MNIKTTFEGKEYDAIVRQIRYSPDSSSKVEVYLSLLNTTGSIFKGTVIELDIGDKLCKLIMDSI